jgi:hypothetical protein
VHAFSSRNFFFSHHLDRHVRRLRGSLHLGDRWLWDGRDRQLIARRVQVHEDDVDFFPRVCRGCDHRVDVPVLVIDVFRPSERRPPQDLQSGEEVHDILRRCAMIDQRHALARLQRVEQRKKRELRNWLGHPRCASALAYFATYAEGSATASATRVAAFASPGCERLDELPHGEQVDKSVSLRPLGTHDEMIGH